MKNFVSYLFVLLFVTQMNGQVSDSLVQRHEQTYKKFIIPAALIATGTVLLNSQVNKDIQADANRFFGSDFHTQFDNVTVFMPMAQIYAGGLLGFEAKNSIKHRTISVVTANSLSYLLVTGMKNVVKEHRPDGSDRLSFPSGHSAIAFTNAAILFQEYKDSNIWYASSGFLFATATGMLRIANNKHFASDVFAGAGIGLASGFLITYWNPLQNLHFGKKNKGTAVLYPQFGGQVGIGALIHPNF